MWTAGEPQAANRGVNAVAVGQGIVEPLEDQGCGAFAHHRSIGRGVEGVSLAAYRIVPQCMGSQDRAYVAAQIHRPDHYRVHLPTLQRSNADLQSAKPGSLLGRHGEARPAEAELACDSAGDDTAQRPQHPPGVERRMSLVA